MLIVRSLIVAVLLGTVASSAQTPPSPIKADVTGAWVAVFETPVGEMRYAYDFKMGADGLLTGTADGPFGKAPLTEGSVKGDVITFVEMLDGAIKVVYTGTIVTKDEIKFSRVVGEFGTEELVARRDLRPDSGR